MLTRRDTLRLLGLAALATSPLLSACGEHTTPGPAVGAPELISADVPRAAGTVSAIGDVVSSMGGFTDHLWSRLGGDDNLALSQYSIACALAMAANGAGGETLRQMQQVLGIVDLSTFNGGLNALTQAVESLAGHIALTDGTSATIELASANQLFGDAGTTFGRPFLDTLAREYGAGMRTVDFRHDAAAATTLINRWTSDRTHDRIPQILPPGTLDAQTRLVLVNALYLRAPWATPFPSTSTAPRPFRLANGSSVEVAMMSGAPQGAVYLSGAHFTGARLPYAGGGLAMTVALPDAGHEPQVLTSLLQAGGLSAAGERLLSIGLPTWRYRVATDLGPPLVSLGMSRAFDRGADFTPMSPDEALRISDVLHQTFVSVDEAGTEAAAATAAVMEASAGQVGGGSLVCNRPFLYVIHDTLHGAPLFVGRVADPRS